MARKDYLDKNPEVAKKFVAAVQEATAYMNAHVADQELLDIATKAMEGTPAPVLQAALKQVGWPTSVAMNDAEWKKTLDFINGLGVLTQTMSVTGDDWSNAYVPSGGGS
ncbi:hypothetical protein ACFQ0B_46965 [Nonomuraea thailandensis]